MLLIRPAPAPAIMDSEPASRVHPRRLSRSDSRPDVGVGGNTHGTQSGRELQDERWHDAYEAPRIGPWLKDDIPPFLRALSSSLLISRTGYFTAAAASEYCETVSFACRS